jgi:hypothetical protein
VVCLYSFRTFGITVKKKLTETETETETATTYIALLIEIASIYKMWLCMLIPVRMISVRNRIKNLQCFTVHTMFRVVSILPKTAATKLTCERH